MSNLVNLERVTRSYGIRVLLDAVSLGVGDGDRIGIVGRNGDGKTTLLNLIAGRDDPDSGRVSRNRGLRLGYLDQRDDLPTGRTVRDVVLAGKADHEWAAEATTREVAEVLLEGIALERLTDGLSGGERRRCALARLLLDEHDLILLDEPTNHLDVEAIAWLAAHLVGRGEAIVVVTHDRWFLDAVCTATWEVHDGVVDSYDGGYAAFVLAKAERQRQEAASEARRRNLVRKELAWLRRGPPARTAKPRFRIDAANALIADEPPARDPLRLERFAVQRLGRDVVDIEDVDLARGDRELLHHATWRIGPGDRVGIVGVNGAGKTTVLRLIAGEVRPDVGRVKHGRTIALAHLTQEVTPLPPTPAGEVSDVRVLDAVQEIRRTTRTASGKEVSATALLERFGFVGDRLTARVNDLSGGERRRFELLRLLLAEPNVLLLDEPTNDLDIETLTVLEDFLDDWPGTLIVVSHDRYFLERVTDSTWALLGDGSITHLPGGVDQYLELRSRAPAPSSPAADPVSPVPGGVVAGRARAGSAEERAARKTIERIDRRLARIADHEAQLNVEMAANAADHEALVPLAAEQRELADEREALETEWLTAADLLE